MLLAASQVRLVDEEDFVPDRRVMAAVYGQGGAGGAVTTFVMLDPAGNLVDFLHCPQFRCGGGVGGGLPSLWVLVERWGLGLGGRQGVGEGPRGTGYLCVPWSYLLF